MPSKRLADEAPAATDIYLDTSGLLAIGFANMQDQPKESARSKKVIDFAARLAQGGGCVKMSVLTIEEAVAKVRRVLREQALAEGEHWREFVRRDPQAAAAVDKKLLKFMDTMVDQALRSKIVLDRPAVKPGATQNSARALRKKHRELLKEFPSLDPMDALHIAVASEMGIKSFISFDRAWAAVREIDVYGD